MEKIIGIYMIKNRINEKVYIGQSRDIEKRWKEHKREKRPRNYLYSAFKSYGIENFSFELLEQIQKPTDQKNLDEREIFYITKFKSLDSTYGYNLKEGGSRGKHSESSKQKNRDSHLGKLTGESNPNYGKTFSAETIKKNEYSKEEYV